MHKNFNIDLVDTKGEKITIKDQTLTARHVIVEALMANPPDDRSTGEIKLKRYQLAMRVNSADGEIDLTPEEIVLIKEWVGRVYGALVVGQVYELLNKDQDKKAA